MSVLLTRQKKIDEPNKIFQSKKPISRKTFKLHKTGRVRENKTIKSAK